MSLTPQTVLIVILVVWTGILTFLFVRFYLFYVRISKGGKKESIIKLIEEVISHQEKNLKHISKNHEGLIELEEENKKNIQKVGLYRFNPFKDTGGDQSFILTFLDGKDSGVIISALHTRTGTRWYAKEVIKGKGTDYELSTDEEKALQSATHMN